MESKFRSPLNWRAIGCIISASLILTLLGGCNAFVPSGPTQDTFVEVPDGDVGLWDDSNHELTHWNTSYARASASKLTYKQFVFHPQLEREQMEKAVRALPIENILKEIEGSHFQFALLHDGTVLASGGNADKNKRFEPGAELAIIYPKTKTVRKLGKLQIPRDGYSVVQIKDGRVIFIGGETTLQYADDGTDNKTNTVEQLDLKTGQTRVIGRILVPRDGIMAEVIGDRDILLVGGWNERMIARDERWWPGAEIFRVPVNAN